MSLAHFGIARPANWGIRLRAGGPGWWAVSRTLLVGLYGEDDPYVWLRARRPAALVGGSSALYDVPEETPTDVDGLMAKGRSLLRDQRDPRRAAATFAEVLRKKPDHFGALYERAHALEKMASPDALPAWLLVEAVAATIRNEPNRAEARRHIEALSR